MTAARLRTLAQNLGLFAASSLVVLAGAEWFLRHYLPQAGFVYRLDPRYLHTLAPGTRKLFQHSEKNGGSRVLFVVNSDGFRGDELRASPATRVVVYGDSFIEAEFAPLGETFAKRLEARLARSLGAGVEVVNAGVNGYGPDQALRRFEDEAARLHPSAVVLAVYAGNDFGDVLRNRLYRLEDGKLADGGGFVAPALRQQFEDAEQRTPFHLLRGLRRLRNAHRRESARARFPERLAVYVSKSVEMCRHEYQQVVVRGERGVDDVFRDHYDADVALAPGSQAAAYKRALLEAVLGRWREVAEAHRVPVLVLAIPDAIDVCDGFDVKIDPSEFPEYERPRLTREATAAASRQGLAVIDLYAPFREAGADGLYYRYDNDHWNARGQDLAGRLAADRILAEGWLSRAR
jgi:hypothetical protein